MQDSKTKEKYEKLIKSLEIAENRVKKIQNKLKLNYCGHIKEKYPAEFAKLEKFLGNSIVFIIATEYEGERGEWAHTVKIGMDCGKDIISAKCTRTFLIQTGNDWYYDENIEGVEETDDKEIKSILDTLYEEFPYINTQYVG